MLAYILQSIVKVVRFEFELYFRGNVYFVARLMQVQNIPAIMFYHILTKLAVYSRDTIMKFFTNRLCI